MTGASARALLRPGLLEGQVVAVAGRTRGVGRAVAAACGELGAHVEQLGDEGHRLDLLDEPAVQEAIRAIAAPEGGIDTVVVDAASALTAGGADAEALRTALGSAWVVARAAATRVMIDAPDGGKIVVLAPAPDGRGHAGAARAGLENLARTLSIEWSCYQVRTVTVAPGRQGQADEMAAVVAYLASPAGDYFSGCVLALDAARQSG
jgi:citronellol/citronellal dehydrogenase